MFGYILHLHLKIRKHFSEFDEKNYEKLHYCFYLLKQLKFIDYLINHDIFQRKFQKYLNKFHQRIKYLSNIDKDPE